MDDEDDCVQPMSGRSQKKPSRPVTEKELNTMFKERTSSEILLRLGRDDGSLDRLLREADINPGKCTWIVKVLDKALTHSEGSQAQPQAVIDIVKVFVFATHFHDKIIENLHGPQRGKLDFIRSVLTIVKACAEALPRQSAVLSHMFLVLEDSIKGDGDTVRELKEKLELVRQLLNQPIRIANQEEENERRREMMMRDEVVDPNLFRELSIVPMARDFQPDEDIVHRANKIQGAYDNINDYLDIQFRLLRADLILPLRENIFKYLDGSSAIELRGVHVYTHVRIVRPICHDKGLCFRLSFDISKHRRINWSVSQRLKFGSLLCLSSDNFETFQCAVVENREANELSRGLVDVQFILQGHGPDIQQGGYDEFMRLINEARDQRFIMVESPSYFEAYKHVLLGLQHFTENNFPFWRYIGECHGQVDPPQYLQNRENPTFDLRPLIDTNYIIRENRGDDNEDFAPVANVATNVDILQSDSWPTANTLSLDNSQFTALQSALTKEFSLIQGPPGTGKTFIGLMVMKALLHNKQIWIGNEGATPILLVCYTNHALDQFLEGILDFFQGKLVRVGSRSKSERLEEYNLRGMRSRARENRSVPIDVHLAKQSTRIEMKNLKGEIHAEAAKLEILEREIVTEFFLKDFMEEVHFQTLTKKGQGESIITRWLGITLDIDRIKKKNDGKVQKRQNQPDGQDRNRAPAADVGGLAAAAGNDEQEEDEEIDLLDMIELTENQQTRHLDIDDDDDDDEDDLDDNALFQELLAGLGDDIIESMRSANKRLDDVDQETIRIKKKFIAFNISEYGEEPVPFDVSTKEAKQHWRSLIPLKKRYRAMLLSHLQKTERMTSEEVSQIYDVWTLSKNDKWRLYRYWVDLYSRQIRGEIRTKAEEYEQKTRRYQEILHQEDKAILEKATIIGMTTTAAARYQGILGEIGPRIVIVEEAAEVLEGHVVTSLTEQCQHVVLIGDHKQLRPNPSVYKLKTDYGLDISLFERLVNNNFGYDCLKYQYRMRPEISQLLRIPDLYPDLRDHEDVKRYPHVMRVKGDVCFINHSELDEREGDTSTFTNPHEAKFVISFCEYLIQQGYRPSQITILSPYAGQTQMIKGQLEGRKKILKSVKGLRVSSVDNYQGEENDIIILSLVRSNEDNEIGFLKANNRICVALSRAKIGLYAIGNFSSLSTSSPLIKEIVNRANGFGYFQDHITLICPNHKDQQTKVKTGKDFENVPKGGCMKPCGIRLECGHSCKRVCHTEDMEHKNVLCSERCRRMCEKCGEYCAMDHPCGDHDVCRNRVDKYIPRCRHKQKMPCYMEPNQFECQALCNDLLPCQHQCQEKCGTRHTHTAEKCKVLVKATPKRCGHGTFSTECWKVQQGTASECLQPCGVVLECGHLCGGTCHQCQNGRLHVNCNQKCQKILICGHECKDTCDSCPPCTLPCETACKHSRCPKKCGEPCTPCLELCSWQCKHEQCKDLCCQPCEREPCDHPCPERLPCGHNCSGLCGEKCPRLCTICNKDELIADSLYGYDGDPTTLFIELDCSHVLEVDFMDQWMKTSTATSEDSDQQAIGLKTCPICKSPVRKCDRYNKKIKEMLVLIESVKRKYIGEKKTEMKQKLDRIVSQLGRQDRQRIDTFLTDDTQVLSETILEAQTNQVNFFRKIAVLCRITKECEARSGQTAVLSDILEDLDHFSEWVLQKRAIFSQQNMLDALFEMERLTTLIELHRLERKVLASGSLREKIPSSHLTRLGLNKKELSEYKRIDEKVLGDAKALCEALKKVVPESEVVLTSQEKMDIVKAVNVSKGAWYKCPNGHIYAIGDCGRAAEESVCPECKSKIGGTSHQLLPNNDWAPEMDDAERPIWDNIDVDRELAEMLQQELNLMPFDD